MKDHLKHLWVRQGMWLIPTWKLLCNFSCKDSQVHSKSAMHAFGGKKGETGNTDWETFWLETRASWQIITQQGWKECLCFIGRKLHKAVCWHPRLPANRLDHAQLVDQLGNTSQLTWTACLALPDAKKLYISHEHTMLHLICTCTCILSSCYEFVHTHTVQLQLSELLCSCFRWHKDK